jgi:hypothetical protein
MGSEHSQPQIYNQSLAAKIPSQHPCNASSPSDEVLRKHYEQQGVGIPMSRQYDAIIPEGNTYTSTSYVPFHETSTNHPWHNRLFFFFFFRIFE